MRANPLAAALLLTITGAAPLPAAPWETIPNCRLIENRSNDGDSFHVRAGGKERIFRLYFVDAAETSNDFKYRTRDQAKDFEVRKERLYQLGEEATVFAASKLSGNFVVKTRWEDAKGQSSLPRYFAVVETPSGDLAELLVAAGLARIHGHNLDHPRGFSSANYQRLLEELESQAKGARRGAWSDSPAPAPTEASEAPTATPTDRPTLQDIPAF